MASTSHDPGELLFERYLAENGCTFEHEPDLGVSTRPDYLVHRDGAEVVCEVKSFPQPAIPAPSRDGSPVTAAEILAPVRNKIRDAARQLRPLRDRDRALVVVLALAENSPVVLGAAMMLSAMYGDLTLRAEAQSQAAEGGKWYFGRNGRLRNDHPYISAVAVHQRRTASDEALIGLYVGGAFARAPAEAPSASADFEGEPEDGRPIDGENQEFLYVEVYETANAAPRIPTGILEGSRDTRWAADVATARVVRTR